MSTKATVEQRHVAWQPSVGAWREGGLTHFRVWVPDAKKLEVVLETFPAGASAFALQKAGNGFFEGSSAEVPPNGLYWYQIDGQGPYPDPASRAQPQGVHGPSQVIDAAEFPWTDATWMGVSLDELVLYEMHVGTFTPAGTFAGAADCLPTLRDLGVTAVELMPVADFPGKRNWGYDGVALFAPARCYGTPDQLRRFIDEAHRTGLAVHLDVVYNHLGPDGAYHGIFSPYYFSQQHKSPWGAAINFDGPHSSQVRNFFIENALHWIHEYHVDGLRLDATHAILDESPRHFLAELAAAIRESLRGSRRQVLVIAEDIRNLAGMVKPESEGGWGLDAIWSDDFHHQMRRCLAGDRDGYFEDFEGTTEDIAVTARAGWFYCGQYARYFGKPRGTAPEGISPRRFVFFLQNHDQVGNRALGDRLHHQIDLAAYRAATALLLLLPQTPLLFMGQEWAASTPFQYFTDHYPELGKLVTEGRRSEFSRFAAFSEPQTRERIPSPQDLRTFLAGQLHWEERGMEPHASTLRFFQSLLLLRCSEPTLLVREAENYNIAALDQDALLLRRHAEGLPALLAVIRLRGAGVEDLRENPHAVAGAGLRWSLLLTSEEESFTTDPMPARLDFDGPVIEFARPGVIILKSIHAHPGGEC
ncbi:MAG: malto-oligosyltrehalose trehalohydrolase [Acidobacteria bacterium]|nr:malto-oligosyltrehalose trehalohydrolase [Acidobacteriota bacterium]